jgi:hypothetical protein
MELNDLFQKKKIDPKQVLVLRHRPTEPKLNRALRKLAAEKPDVFNAYQQTQTSKLENAMKAMTGAGYVASFIGHEPGKALFVGLYTIGACKPLTREEFWQVPAYIGMQAKYDLRGPSEDRSSILWFDLVPTEFYAAWKGRLIVEWPPPELSWWRRAHRNTMPILAVLEDTALDPPMPDWREIALEWEELSDLSPRWKSALCQWRGVYYIFDKSDGKGYVGSAYGESDPEHHEGNLLGRWLGYAASGHGGNALLRKRDPHNFQFSILERVGPDMSATDVIRLEGTWKDRLHTRSPDGLNDN